MGAWGYKALESDEGLDVVAFLREFMEQHKESNQLTLSDIGTGYETARLFW